MQARPGTDAAAPKFLVQCRRPSAELGHWITDSGAPDLETAQAKALTLAHDWQRVVRVIDQNEDVHFSYNPKATRPHRRTGRKAKA